jgi:hypothetical protein
MPGLRRIWETIMSFKPNSEIPPGSHSGQNLARAFEAEMVGGKPKGQAVIPPHPSMRSRVTPEGKTLLDHHLAAKPSEAGDSAFMGDGPPRMLPLQSSDNLGERAIEYPSPMPIF